tara:strand:- start:3339 stop:4181 length:843 start_codon:yes stop_codon:yes gene_type:complete
MGLGGLLTWTAAIREISNKNLDERMKIVPCKTINKTITETVKSPVLNNNPYIYDAIRDDGEKLFFLPMNLPETSYCKEETPTKVNHRYDKHIIEQICEYYGILEPELKCELYFLKEEEEKALKMVSGLPRKYIAIEPHSKNNYTPNRRYPFEKWQSVVDSLKNEITFVQIGQPGHKILENVISLLGETTFRESALIIKNSQMFISTEGGLGHAANAVGKKSLIVLTGYQGYNMVAYPENINLDISSHGPCGLKIKCERCFSEAENHDYLEIVDKIRENLA